MSDLSGQVGELRMVVTITRKATGQVEEYQLVGAATKEQLQEILNDSHPLDSSPERSD